MKSRVRMIAVAGVLAMAACGGDDGVSPGALTEAQAEELAAAIFSQSLFDALTLNYSQPPQAAGGPQLATYTATVDATGQCPMGGQVSIQGTVDVQEDDQTGDGSVDFSIDLVHAACVVQGDMGTQFTLTGSPSLAFDFLMSTVGESAAFDGAIVGAVAWATDNADGTCSISYEFSGEATQNGFSFQTNGNVCGNTFSESVSFSGG